MKAQLVALVGHLKKVITFISSTSLFSKPARLLHYRPISLVRSVHFKLLIHF